MARKSRHTVHENLPNPDDWEIGSGIWREDSDDGPGTIFETKGTPLSAQLGSPVIHLKGGILYSFRLTGKVLRRKKIKLALVPDSDMFVKFDDWVKHRNIEADGDFAGSFAYLPASDGAYRLVLTNGAGTEEDAVGAVLSDLGIDMTSIGPVGSDSEVKPSDTYLPSWGPLKRKLHDLCKQHRRVNAFVAALEMKLEREEAISLPSFIAICPTGQCNALCDFCSVTINRTGIVKRQLPWEHLSRFLQPLRNVLQMCGLEGNGEPTLYKEFDELLGYVKGEGSEVYLITNGSRLTHEQIPSVLGLNAITFSVNAATAATHRKVMKLKNWPDVIGNIRQILRERGTDTNPVIYLSFVAYHYNIHELQDFLKFAESELKGDKIVIRPLSELGTDTLGTIEDLRDIVPYESDVQDAIDSVKEYLNDVPRRVLPLRTEEPYQTEIIFDQTAFRNVRPDPSDRVVMPSGYEGRLLAPRRDDWTGVGDGVRALWHLNTVHLLCNSGTSSGVVWYSAFTPVNPDDTVVFECAVTRTRGCAFSIQVVNEEGEVLQEQKIDPEAISDQSPLEILLSIHTGENRQLALQFARTGEGSFWAEIDFERLRTPGTILQSSFTVSNERRWALDNPEARIDWRDSVMNLSYAGGNSSYLYKSYFMPCVAHQPISFPISATLTGGPLVLGVLDDGAQNWIKQIVLEEGKKHYEITIDPGENSRIQFVFFSKSGECFDASIDWGDVLGSESARHSGTETGSEGADTGDLPISGYVNLCDPDVWRSENRIVSSYVVDQDGVNIKAHSVDGSKYLAQVEQIAVPAQKTFCLEWDFETGEGGEDFTIGVLNAESEKFLATTLATTEKLTFSSEDNLSISIVFYANEGTTGNVRLRWRQPEKRSGAVKPIPVTYALQKNLLEVSSLDSSDSPPKSSEASAPKEVEPSDYSDAERLADEFEATGEADKIDIREVRELSTEEAQDVRVRRGQKTKRASLWRRLTGRRSHKYYCQKPWTDLNNFSVDGRMDVCCITTGASQSQFALGNILEDDFQALWNGDAIREFRKTVNSSEKLPPCARCPMSHSYAGLFFSRRNTIDHIRAEIWKRWDPDSSIARRLESGVKSFLDRFHFDDFRK
jgi:MoaA/NifB/PqqE/SkfB family radical SAM enzyme